jgi:protein SCO1/2
MARLHDYSQCIVAMLLAAALLTLAGCSQPQHWGMKNITNLMPDLQFTLTDQSGKTVHAKDYRGKVLLLYFGYTHCPDVCPTTLANLTQALKGLGEAANAVRVLFVSVDPARDTPTVLRDYVHAFGPQFVGLRGDDATLRNLTMRYRVTYALDKPDAEGNYAVSHSSAVFVFDQRGRVRLLGRGSDKPATIASDLKRLMAGA